MGMLRDKETLLLELQSAVAQTLMAQRDVAQKRRIEYQEKALAAMRHVRNLQRRCVPIFTYRIYLIYVTLITFVAWDAGFDGGVHAFQGVRSLR